MGAKKFKGFIFTLDAVFALVVAAVGVSILLYANFSGQISGISPTTQAYNLLETTLQTSTLTSSQGSLYTTYLISGTNGSVYSWPQFGHDGELSSSVGTSLQAPFLLYTLSAPSRLTPSFAIDDGVVAAQAGSKLYIINATSGVLEHTFSPRSGAAFVSAPAIYRNILYSANATNVIATNINGTAYVWNYSYSNTIFTPLVVENNYLAFGTYNGFYLLNPLNGSLAAFAATNVQTQLPVYVSGEYVAATNVLSGNNFLYSYSLYANSLVQTWNVPLAGLQTTEPCSINNTVAVGSGSYFYIVSSGGQIIFDGLLPYQILGISGQQNAYYVQTTQKIYGFTSSGNAIFNVTTFTDNENSTPSVGAGVLYTLINGNLFQGYSTSRYVNLWNITLPSSIDYGYSNIALAYGNIYVPNGDTLYVFGTYKPGLQDSVLQSVAGMYLDNQEDYSNILLNNLYNFSSGGIFINNTYAPDLGVATFNSATSSYIEQSSGFGWMNNAISQFTISIWVDPSSNNGVIVDELDGIAPNTNWHNSTLDLANGIVYAKLGGEACMALGRISTNSWSNIVLTYNSATAYGYINGALATNTLSGLRSVPGNAKQMYYPLGVGDANNNCGSGSSFNGSMLNYQFYNTSVTNVQAAQIYHNGAFGVPNALALQSLKLWLPLDGNTNDFSGAFNLGLPYNIKYSKSSYLPPGYSNSYQISRAWAPVYINSKTYNVSVVVWR